MSSKKKKKKKVLFSDLAGAVDIFLQIWVQITRLTPDIIMVSVTSHDRSPICDSYYKHTSAH